MRCHGRDRQPESLAEAPVGARVRITGRWVGRLPGKAVDVGGTVVAHGREHAHIELDPPTFPEGTVYPAPLECLSVEDDREEAPRHGASNSSTTAKPSI